MSARSDEPAPPQKPTAAELLAPALIAVAMIALATTLVRQRIAGREVEVRPWISREPVVEPPKMVAIVTAPPQEGVKIIPSPGRLLLIDSTPSGANIFVDGVWRGETPFSSDFACVDSQRTVVELKRSGYKQARYELDCVEGTTRISATLVKGR